MLSALFAFAAVMAVSAQTPPFSGQTVLKPGLNNNYCLTAEGTTDGSNVDMQPCQSNAANQAWTFSGGQVQIYGGSKCLDVKTAQTKMARIFRSTTASHTTPTSNGTTLVTTGKNS